MKIIVFMKKIFNRQIMFFKIVLYLFFLITIFLKSMYFQFSAKLNGIPIFSYTNAYMSVSNISCILFILAIIIILSKKRICSIILIVNLLITIIIFSNLIYFRYYNNVISVGVFYNIAFLNTAIFSILDLIKFKDIFLICDFAIMPIFFIIKNANGFDKEKISYYKKIISVIVVLCLGIISFQIAYKKIEKTPLNYDNNYIASKFGLLYFNYFEAKRFFVDEVFKNRTISKDEITKLDNFYKSKEKHEKNQYSGIGKGKNLIVVQMEACQNYLINRTINGVEITPNMNKLVESSLYFPNFFSQAGIGNTSDAEFLTNNSLYPLSDKMVYFSYPSNDYFTITKILKERNYKSHVFHAYYPSFYNRTIVYNSFGFDLFHNIVDYKIDETIGWGLSDTSFLRQSIDKIDTLNPFYGFL